MRPATGERGGWWSSGGGPEVGDGATGAGAEVRQAALERPGVQLLRASSPTTASTTAPVRPVPTPASRRTPRWRCHAGEIRTGPGPRNGPAVPWVVMALISSCSATGRTYSFEFFPPKNDAEQARLVRTLRELQPLAPSFVSVTYRGGRSSRQRTHDLVVGMLRTTTLTPMAHLICVAHTRLELAEILVEFRKAGVENLMALGGDPPTDPDAAGELRHAVGAGRAGPGHRRVLDRGGGPSRRAPRSPDMERTGTTWPRSCAWPTSGSPSSSSGSTSTCAWWTTWPRGGSRRPWCPASCR